MDSIDLLQMEVEDVVLLLEITTEELLQKFSDKFYEHSEKFGVEKDDEEEQETD